MTCTAPIRLGLNQVQYPCGKCANCKKNRSFEWAIRLTHEADKWKDAIFITLTYRDEDLPENKSLDKNVFINFFKRLRYYRGVNVLKYFACGEYGDGNRPHYHAIIFGMRKHPKCDPKKRICLPECDLRKSWEEGFVYCGTVTPASIRYVTNYVLKKSCYPEGKEKPFQLQSKGLGLDFALENRKQIESGNLRYRGIEVKIPRYYVKKLEIGFNEKREAEYFARKQKEGERFVKIHGHAQTEEEYNSALAQENRNVGAREKLTKERKYESIRNKGHDS